MPKHDVKLAYSRSMRFYHGTFDLDLSKSFSFPRLRALMHETHYSIGLFKGSLIYIKRGFFLLLG